MSVQLIVYPQSYDGSYNAISSSPSEALVNGISFTNLDNSTSYDSPHPSNIPLDVLTNAPPIIVNTWYRYRSITFGTPNLPDVVTGNLVLYSTTTLTLSGIYQKLSNLTPGSQYTFTIDISTPAANGSIVLSAYNGTNLITQPIFSAALSQITHTFTAASTSDTIIISYFNSVSNSVTISNASIQPVIGAVASGAIQILGDGQVICDLYEDEDLPLTLSVDDFKNVAEKVQSYSKAFNLPSTKRNNKIFNAIFDVTRSYDGLIFNPYKRTQCVLKQDGFILFEGYLRLLDVTDKEGEISYNVNLYSEVIALADTLKDRAFRDLDFTELEHAYNRTQITNSWNDGGTGITYTNPSTSGFRDAYSTVKYPFVDWNHQIIVAATGGTPTAGNPELPTLETAFRPFISIKYLIDRIFEASEFTYESAFFNTTDFEKLYMDFNWGGDNIPSSINDTYLARWNFNTAQGFPPPIPSNIGNNSFKEFHLIPETITPSQAPSALPPNYNTTTNILTATTNNEIYDISYTFLLGKTSATSETIECQWLHNSTPINQQTIFFPAPNTLRSYTGTLQIALQIGDTLSAQFKGDTDIRQNETFSSTCVFVQSSATISTTTLQVLRGEVGQWDFLKGLITMFNLVTLVDEDNPNNILIEPYSDVFIPTATGGTTLANRGIEHDWTDKIDVSEMKLTPLTDLTRKTMFKFVEDDDDYSFNQYKNQVGGHLYGSQLFNAGDEFNILDGEEEILAEPFAATVVKPLMSQFPDFITPAIYAMNDDVSEGFENSPRIMFNNGIKSTGASYYIPEQNGVVGTNETNYLQFSHLTEIPTSNATPSTTIDFHFGICQLMTGVGTPTPNNLFNLYWLPYYSELYNPNTRTMTLKVNLSPADINTFRFNDRVFIKNRVFRVNKIDYKPNDLATVEFILIP